MAAAVEDSGMHITHTDHQDPEKAASTAGDIEHIHDVSRQPETDTQADASNGLNLQTALAFIV